MEKIKVSIIVPVYNCENYVETCIESLINQTIKNIEIILIDDGSTDNSLNILKKYESSKVKVISKPNDGVQKTRELGYKMSTGDYIMFVDADDWIELNTLEKLFDLNHNEIDVIRFNYLKEYNNKSIKNNAIIDLSDEKMFNEVISKKDFPKKFYPLLFKGYDFNTIWGQLIKRSLIDIDMFNEDLKYAEDLYFNLCLYEKVNKINIVNNCYYHYRYNPFGAINSKDSNKAIKCLEDNLYVYMYLYDYSKSLKISVAEKNEIAARVIKEIIILVNKLGCTRIGPKKFFKALDTVYSKLNRLLYTVSLEDYLTINKGHSLNFLVRVFYYKMPRIIFHYIKLYEKPFRVAVKLIRGY